MSEGSAIPLSWARIFTVVPFLAAMADRLSPDLTTYVRRADGDGLWSGDAAGAGDGLGDAAGLAEAVGDGVGRGLGWAEGDSAGGADGLARATPRPSPGPLKRATRMAARARPISASNAPWVMPLRRARMASDSVGRPRSRTTGVARGTGN